MRTFLLCVLLGLVSAGCRPADPEWDRFVARADLAAELHSLAGQAEFGRVHAGLFAGQWQRATNAAARVAPDWRQRKMPETALLLGWEQLVARMDTARTNDALAAGDREQARHLAELTKRYVATALQP